MPEPAERAVITYAGQIDVRDHGEAFDVVFVGDGDDPFAERFSDDLESHGRYVTVRYHITERQHPVEELEENLIRRLAGAADANYADHYSDITGYLWTDEDLNIGGHDLLDELRDGDGRYLLMIVEFRREGVSDDGR